MFPTFISIIDIQSWWEVPSIAHFCSLFRTAFNLLDFDIEDLEEALLTDGTEEATWLQELIVKLLSGCLPHNEISTFNYQMFLRRLFRQKCQEHDQYNPFNTDVDFQLLPLRTKVDILHALCDFRLDADDVLEQLKNLEADSLRVEPLGHDNNDSAYWYFYGTRLYREDFKNKSKKGESVWQVICFTEEDWFQLAKKFKKSTSKVEKQLYRTLTENFLPELPRLFQEKEKLARKRLLEKPRKSSRIQKLEFLAVEAREEEKVKEAELEKEKKIKEESTRKKLLEQKRREAYERRVKRLNESEDSHSGQSESRYEMVGSARRNKRGPKGRQRKHSSSSSSQDRGAKGLKSNMSSTSSTAVGRQTNNSLASATGQIVIQPVANPHRKKLKTSQVFRQTDEDLQTGMHKILDHIKDHDDAWPFIDPVEEEYAPNYYSIIRKPMDLQKMEERLDAGHYKTFSRFQADFQLIVDNCRLYNGVENEYTEMVDNLSKVFERATERYLDQITSSDDEIAVEFPETEDTKGTSKKRKSDQVTAAPPPAASKRKPTLAAQTDKKRDGSISNESKSDAGSESDSNKRSQKKQAKSEMKDTKKEVKNNSKHTKVIDKLKTNKQKSGKEKKIQGNSKNSKKSKSPILSKRSGSSSRNFSRSPSRDKWSSSPPPSWPPSSPERRFDFFSSEKSQRNNTYYSSDEEVQGKWKDKCKENQPGKAVSRSDLDNKTHKKHKSNNKDSLFSLEQKDKHNKLRETIEKLKAKSELSKFNSNDRSRDKFKQEKSKKPDEKAKFKERVSSKSDIEEENSTVDSVKSDNKSSHMKSANYKNSPSKIEALTLATEQTLKDINKWLDDAPGFSEFSSASNSPSHYIPPNDFDVLEGKDQESRKKGEKTVPGKKDVKEIKRRPFHRDPAKFLKRREIHRTIDRLQPGKSKGNLLSNIQTSKPEELFPLGPLSKLKDTKNSLIVKTDDTTPKLSLGSVLDSFGKHKFIDDPKKEGEEEIKEVKPVESIPKQPVEKVVEEAECKKPEAAKVEEKVSWLPKKGNSPGKATPNLSAWFKAFGAPKAQQTQKKTENKFESKETSEEIIRAAQEQKKDDTVKKVTPPEISPNPESPASHGQPTTRQRRISTGSSISERSSFSQDMDSPRVGIDERLGAYPAPYPSPLHRSPSGASPVMASPRPEMSPKGPAYPTFNGQIRVGFYQDTVSSKSSPDKSCSPRENPQSPYPQYSEHVYAPPSSTQPNYSYNNPYSYSQTNYTNANPTLPYATEQNNPSSFYDTNKPLTDQYQAKLAPTYSNNMSTDSSPSPLPSPNTESRTEKLPIQNAVFPVKKRVYSENEQQIPRYDRQDYNPPEGLGKQNVANPLLSVEETSKQYVHQNIPDPKALNMQTHPEMYGKPVNSPSSQMNREAGKLQTLSDNSGSNLHTMGYAAPNNSSFNTYNSEINYPLNIPSGSTRPPDNSQDLERKLDMSKYTNMGYTGTDMSFSRSSPQYGYGRPVTSQPDTTVETSNSQMMSMRYPNPAMSMNYKDLNIATSSAQQVHTPTLGNVHQNVRVSSESRILPNSRCSYGGTVMDMDQSLGLRGNLANLTHIVDRFPSDERMLSGLQPASGPYYGEKSGPPPSHMFSKPIATSSSGLPILTQPSMTMPYSHEVRGVTSTMYSRQMTELQNPGVISSDSNSSVLQQQQQQEKKMKRRKSNKTAVTTSTQESAPNNTQNQGFQSYAGLKNNSSMEPSAISLKTASVVPGSAFNFGPTPAGLGLGSGLYGDKESYPNYLEDFRSAPNYYMAAAAAAHHRSTPDAAEKTARSTHQPSTAQPPSYSFLGTPQPRPPSYPLGTPFMTPHQAQLMDPSSPLYQQYMLHQGLLGPAGAYPPGYHPALSMRQPYDSMTRPSWL